jgi:hypothetical protein
MAVLPAGLPGVPGIVLPAWSKLRPGKAGKVGAQR